MEWEHLKKVCQICKFRFLENTGWNANEFLDIRSMQIKMLPLNFRLCPSRIWISPYRLWALSELQLQWCTRFHLYRCSGFTSANKNETQKTLLKMSNSPWKQFSKPKLIFNISPTKYLPKTHRKPCEVFHSCWPGACRYSRIDDRERTTAFLSALQTTLYPQCCSKDWGVLFDTGVPVCIVRPGGIVASSGVDKPLWKEVLAKITKSRRS